MTDTLLEQIKELRPKVTQGKWRQSHRARRDGMYATEVYSEDNQTICTLSWWYDKSIKGQAKTLRAENAQFIALAPQMADRIIADAALRAENERLRGWLLQLVLHIEDDDGVVPDWLINKCSEQVENKS